MVTTINIIYKYIFAMLFRISWASSVYLNLLIQFVFRY